MTVVLFFQKSPPPFSKSWLRAWSYLAVMDRFVKGNSRDLLPGPNPASSKAIDTPFTSLSANVSGAAGYFNILAPSRPNLNLFPQGKNNRCFCTGWFRTHTHPNRRMEPNFRGC